MEIGRYFYTDIKKEGILLYNSGEFTLSEAKELPWSEMKEIAKVIIKNGLNMLTNVLLMFIIFC
nr:hypothetical protein [Rickettsia endosymbiont of Ixodes scapularis]